MTSLEDFLDGYEPRFEFGWKREPFKHQLVLADWHMAHDCSFDQSGVGVGKTLPMVTVLQEMFFRGQITRALILATTSILDNWAKEISAGSDMTYAILRGTKKKRLEALATDVNCYILNYEGLRVIFDELMAKGFDALVADECFPWETPILTDVGWLPIGMVVDMQLDLFVLSCDLLDNKLEWRRIDRWINTPVSSELVCVTHESGSFTCTANHRIWTNENGYIEAQSLSQNHSLRMVPEFACDISKRTDSSAFLFPVVRDEGTVLAPGSCSENLIAQFEAADSQGLCAMPRSVFFEEQRRGIEASTILRKIMLGEMANVAAGYSQICLQRGSQSEDIRIENREEKSAAFGISQDAQSHVQSIIRRKSSAKIEGAPIPGKGWQWALNRASIDSLANGGTGNRAPGYDDQREIYISVNSELLQGGLSSPEKQDSYRDRRESAQNAENNEAGSKKGVGAKSSRVVRVEILKRRSYDIAGIDCSKNNRVYNIEVEGNHNYFANGVLVSNCHHIKSPGASQTKLALKLAKNAHVRKAMSGTLLTNDLMDIWSTSQFVNPAIFRTNQWGFRNQYMYDANAGAWWKKYPDWQPRPGATDQVREKLADHSIGYEKRDVLKFLPPVTVERRYVELSDEQKKSYRELKREFLLELASGQIVLAPEILPRIAKLLEITSGFIYTDSGTHRFATNAKLDELHDVLKQIGDDRAIIWTSFTEDARVVRDSLKAPAAIIDGSVKQQDRQPLVNAFNDGQLKYLVCNAACAGEGLTILAPYSIYFSRSWKLGERVQSLGRFDRPGAERFAKLTVIDIVAEGTLDVAVLDALDGKEDLLKSISPQRARDMV